MRAACSQASLPPLVPRDNLIVSLCFLLLLNLSVVGCFGHTEDVKQKTRAKNDQNMVSVNPHS